MDIRNSHKARAQFRSMMRWAINKMFESEEIDTISLDVLVYELSGAFNDLQETGDLIPPEK